MMTTTTPDLGIQLTLNRYTSLMKEVKIRIPSIADALNGKTGLPDFLVQEYCFLQLRMACEIIALGCLLAHRGHLPGAASMREEHSAGEIMKGLEELLPDFYPLPTSQTMGEDGTVHIKAGPDEDCITKAELIALSGRCGRYLHRGTLTGLFGVRPRRRTVHFDEIANHAQRIYNLLSSHSMVLADRQTYFYCTLSAQPGDRVQTWMAK